MEFVSLHNHCTHSTGDGHGSVLQHVVRNVELGMDTVPLTDHGTVSGHAQLEVACRMHNVKPVFGCELYVTEGKSLAKFHQTVLAMDEEGYRNLCKLVTRSYKEGFYKDPTVHTEWLLDPVQTRGLIVLSGCADSWLSCTILGGKAYGDRRSDWVPEDLKAGRRLVERFQAVYGDRYYMEAQRFPGLERSTILNQAFADISSVTGCGLAATADVHYTHPEMSSVQRILHATSRGRKTVEEQDRTWEYDIPLTYPESDEQIKGQFREQELTETEIRQAVTNTRIIADRCNVELPKSTIIRYPITDEDLKPWV